MLGFDISERTISRWMKRAPRDPERPRRWLAFLKNHREAVAAMDFFTVPTLRFSALYGFLVTRVHGIICPLVDQTFVSNLMHCLPSLRAAC
jgi:hypothetical protein